MGFENFADGLFFHGRNVTKHTILHVRDSIMYEPSHENNVIRMKL